MLQGKNAVITGARRGIGRAAVECFAGYGANVWACARKPDEAFEADMADLAEKHGVWIKPVYFDLADSTEMAAAVKGILVEKLPVDVLVNNAGMPYGGTLFTTPMAKLQEVFQVNFFAQIALMQYFGKYMLRKKSGSIVNVVSVQGLEHNPGTLSYGSSKAALGWATRSCAKELAPHGVRVNGVAPGLTDTYMGHYREPAETEKVLARIPMGRMAGPAEIAEAIAFLSSDKASYITGEILVADGGKL